jgi:hypothetical protein
MKKNWLFLTWIATFVYILPGYSQEAKAPANEVRFPVAHAHITSWCMGYLYVSGDSVRYEVVRPEKDKNHGFRISRSGIGVQQWMRLGALENAVEIRTAHATYHFWWMPNEDDLDPGRPAMFNPSLAAPPDTLIAALRDPSTALGGNSIASAIDAGQQAEPASQMSAQAPFLLTEAGTNPLPLPNPAAHTNKSDMVGTWIDEVGPSKFTLTLNADRSGSLNSLDIRWHILADTLSLAASTGAATYRFSLSGASLTLSEGGLPEPQVFQRAKPNLSTSAFLGAFDSDDGLPVAGRPPLTREIVNKQIQFFEWVLDVQLTQEQRAQYRDVLVSIWKTGRQEEIDMTVNLTNFDDQLKQKRPEEAELMRERVRTPYLDIMRKQPDDPFARWVVGIYDSAHRAIAPGNPPLTAQVVDAYAELVSFIVNECLQKNTLRADRRFKDQLAQNLIREYRSYSPEQQQELSQTPLLWKEIRFRWVQLSGVQREAFRQEVAQSMMPLISGGAPASNTTSTAPDASVQNYFDHYNEHQFVKSVSNSSFSSTMSLHLNMWK